MKRVHYIIKIAFLAICSVFQLSCDSNLYNTKLFKLHTPNQTGISFSNDIVETEEFNILEYLYMYNGGGVAIGDINNDGLPDIYLTANQQINRLYLNKGNFEFDDITEKAGVGGDSRKQSWTTGTVMADVNNDGWLDIYVCQIYGYKGLTGNNKLYINNQNGTFTESAAIYGLQGDSYSQHAAFFDYDNDGDLDMYLLNLAVHTPDSYKNAALRSVRDTMSGDRLYQNREGKFVDVSKEAGIFGGSMGYGLAVGISDINNDGYQDIYVSNDFHENDYLYYNQGNGTFKEANALSMGHNSTFAMGNDIGDFNNDGWQDIITLDMKPNDEKILKTLVSVDPYDIYQLKLNYGYHFQYPRNMLQLNNGNLYDTIASFSEIGEYSGVTSTDWSWSALFADFDLDGKKDLFISNGIPHRPNNLDFINYTSNANQKELSTLDLISSIPSGKARNVAFKNMGVKFEDVSEEWGLDQEGFSNGVAYADLDNDGDLDLVVNNLNEVANLYENTISERQPYNYLEIKFKGPSKNTKGIGAKVILEVGGVVNMQELHPSRGWLSSMDYNLIFGLGKFKTGIKLKVIWNDGKEQIIDNLKSNQTITLDYAESVAPETEVPIAKSNKVFYDVSNKSGIDFKHEENSFNDFKYENLIPRMVSREGPKIAIGDLNNDGLEDFYIGGAKNQEGEIYIQQDNKEKLFKKVRSNDFFKDRASEDAGSVFLDVDNDGDLDLYVISGGGEPFRDFTKADRLYLNDGKGNFTKTTTHPQLAFNGSCAVSGDFNEDGIPDIFIGARSIPGAYGTYTRSRILIGDGKGNLIDVTARIFGKYINLGMVTDAAWLPKSRELIVVGDWMPVTILDFKNLPLEEKKIENSSGWWNTIHSADFDNDGDLDLVLGNLGLNTNLTASITYPVNLYIKDFDNNQTIDPIMSYYKKGIEYPFYGLGEMSKQLVAMKKVYPSYALYANSSFSDLFPKDELKGAGRLQAFTFASCYFENNNAGRFIAKELPWQLQLAPLYGFATGDFNGDGAMDILTGGNFYGNQVNIGKLDASFGHFLSGNGKLQFKNKEPRDTGFYIQGEVRDIKVIKGHKGENLILVSRNNEGVKLFTYSIED